MTVLSKTESSARWRTGLLKGMFIPLGLLVPGDYPSGQSHPFSDATVDN